jgi:hypothetical protein
MKAMLPVIIFWGSSFALEAWKSVRHARQQDGEFERENPNQREKGGGGEGGWVPYREHRHQVRGLP